MKGSLLWKFMYLFCAMAGILAGYGVFTLAGAKENTEPTKDNTLVREAGDGVFFDAEKEDMPETEISEPPIVTVAPTVTVAPATPAPTATISPKPTEIPAVTVSPKVTNAPAEVSEDKLPSLGRQWASTGETVPKISETPAAEPVQESLTTQTLTYPAKIFGQVPVLNRSDAYVSYFEFAYDLIAMMEPVVSAKGLSMNSLLTKFAIKALFCGVDIEKLDINAPIPRRLAALCLWLAAQVLNESGCDTSSKSAGAYVTDISGCSASERKAIAYLYESGILKGYRMQGQMFYPEAGLKTEAGNNWLASVKQCWK
ncbi:MAG: S-layer homology domain-containing protein [Lachnospiraceae bacterium]|nr:S-layer homology domain-containing protein [Lachnospiraceae bacterium]